MKRFLASAAPWIAMILVAIGLRLAAGFWWQARLPADKSFFFGDSDGYWQLGRAIAGGEPYQWDSPDRRVFRTPGYPLLLAGMFRVVGTNASPLWGRALSAALGGATVAAVAWWAAKLFSPRAGWLAGWIAAVYPGAIAMGAFVLSEAAFCPFMAVQLGLWSAAWRSASARSACSLALGAGIAAGAATLIRPSWILFTPLACAAAFVIDRGRKRQALVAAAMLLALCVTMSPWWLRNARLTGHFVPTTLQMGASLYDGLNPQADGGSNMQFVEPFEEELRAADRRGETDSADSFEYRLDRRLRDASLTWAGAHPGRVLELAGLKFVRLWNVWPNELSMRSWPLRLAVLFSYVPLLVLGVYGAWKFRAAGWPYVLAWLPAVYFTILHLVFVSSIRYREPAMLGLAVLAAGVTVVRGPLSVANARDN